MLDCGAAVACVVMGLEATEDRKAAAREMIKQVYFIILKSCGGFAAVRYILRYSNAGMMLRKCALFPPQPSRPPRTNSRPKNL